MIRAKLYTTPEIEAHGYTAPELIDALGRKVTGGFVLGRNTPFPDAGAADDPFVCGLHGFHELCATI